MASSIDSGNLSMAPITPPVSRTELVAQAIKEAILRGELQPGQKLVERELAARLGVSKTPVREALKILSRSGLVATNAYQGNMVQDVDWKTARSVYRVRLLLEPEAVFLAAPNQSPEAHELLRDVLREAERAAEREDYGALSLANRRFHRLLYEPCENEVLRMMLDDIQDRVALFSVVGWRHRFTWGQEAEEHNAILEAVESGDATEAKKRLSDHISRFLANLEESFADEAKA